MTPEELAYHQNFLWPMYLILIGGAITGGLIPYFNRLHEGKQKRIDRNREDYKFELQIKSEILERLTEFHSTVFREFGKITDEDNDDEVKKMLGNFSHNLVNFDGKIKDYLTLYFNSDEELDKLWSKIYFMITKGTTLVATISNSGDRKEWLEKFLEVADMTLDEEEMKQAIEETDIPDPVFSIFGILRKMKSEINDYKFSN